MTRYILARARRVFKEQGWLALLTKGMRFLKSDLLTVKYQTRFVYEHTIKERDPADFMPDIQDFKSFIVRNNQQADELEAEGYEFRSHQDLARMALDSGAVAFCIFIQGELAHIGWVALTEEARRYVDNWPFKVDFNNAEACTGNTLTIPKFRGKGLMKYGYYQRFEFLRKLGIQRSRNSVGTTNIAAQRVHAKFGPKIYAKIRYLKILTLISWKEKPLTTDS